MELTIQKARRRLSLSDGAQEIFSCRIALGREPVGAKEREGDGRTPEGTYYICLVKKEGKYGRSLGLSYPSPADASDAFREGRIDQHTLEAVFQAHVHRRRPPWGSPLGGEIYIHEGGTASDWTQGCIALESEDMDKLFPLWEDIDSVIILP